MSDLEYPHIEVLPDPARRFLRTPPPEGYNGWWPATGAQEAALDCQADILMLGGTLGSLKTSTILVDLIQERDSPRMVSYFFRRTYPALKDAIRQSRLLFPATGALPYNQTDHSWRWPCGATFKFRQLASQRDLDDNFGKELSAIGIDQSEQMPEDWVRFLISRNRSSDPGLKIRIRLGANPGGEGGRWHMGVFFNGVCPHCSPELAPPQGVLRTDAKWHSDGVPIGLTVSYILSSVREHGLLGDDYIKRVQMQHPATAKALLDGCWRTFEGQYFDLWDYSKMTFPESALSRSWFLPRWVGCDYGFSISAPFAHLAAQSLPSVDHPHGVVYVVDEIGGHNFADKASEPFAHAIVDRWVVEEGTDGRKRQIERRWMPWYLSPDAFADRGGQFTLAGQMNKVLDPYGLYFQKARDDRAGGWMKMYNALRQGDLLICEKCQLTIAAIESRLRDPKKENDILKVRGDELDDAADSLRYLYYSWATAQEASMPAKERVSLEMQQRWAQDPTAAMVRYPDLMQEVKKEGQPMVYGGSARQRMRQQEAFRRR